MVDVQAQVDAVSRAVSLEDVEGVLSRVQRLTQTYSAGLADVWDAVTSAERIPRWFLPISGDLRLGGSYQLEGNAGGVIEECAPPSGDGAHFRVTWVFGGGAPTWLTVTLTAVAAESTRLELFFFGHAADLPVEMYDQFGPSATGMGWDSCLLGLSLYLTDASARITPEEAAAWVLTDEGKRFMRLSADAWAVADVASGSKADSARAAAERCYLMYTGQAEGPWG